MKKNKFFLALSLIVAAMLTLCACAGSTSKDAVIAAPAYAPEPVAAPAAPAAPMAEDSMMEPAEYASEYGSGAGALTASANIGEIAENSSLPQFGGRKVIRTLNYNIETEQFDADYATISQRVTSFNGYFQNNSIDGKKPQTYKDRGRIADMCARIPAVSVDAFVQGLQQIGTITYANENAEDITQNYFDKETRLEVLRTQLDRLKSILVKTDNLADIIALENEIANVTLEIEELTTEIRRYDGLIDYCTVYITLSEKELTVGPAAVETFDQRISKGFEDTINGLGVFFEDLAVFLIISSPVWIILGAIVLVTLLLVRRANKRKKARLQAQFSQPNTINTASGAVNNKEEISK